MSYNSIRESISDSLKMMKNVHPHLIEKLPGEGGAAEKVRGDFSMTCDDHLKYQQHTSCHMALVPSPIMPT